ncbi:hypothetical protein FB45DRAFT_1053732 [Roridomyces roridus]|uniref:F-box domain-containing protein n=1 Tax=Roridomyces roridus TaxID=1738132 RepID=A0AAD7C7B4_9AGAR|nr:hypothetical protein FB45DRAFT_1053732 [Roridomyces roridus]
MAHIDPKASRAADRSRILQIDAEIQELEKRLRLLRIERDGPQKRLEAYKYPVLTLPNEIVSEIFVHTLPLYPACPPLIGPASPIPLTHIGRKWREIAITTPQLWRAICVSACGQGIRRKQTEVVRTWLDRSKSCPLSIQIEKQKGNHPVLQEIDLHRERWEQVVTETTGSALRSFFKGSMPMLRNLSVTMQDDTGVRPAVSPVDLPRLRRVSLTWFRYPVDWLPCAQLTSLTLNAMHSPNYIPILRHAIHLVNLTFIGCDLFTRSEAQSQLDIPLTQLTSLVIVASNVVRVLNLISIPTLHTLWLSGGDLGDFPMGTLCPLISRCGNGKLRKVLVVGHLSRGVSKKAFRSAFPTISEISFNSRFRFDARQEGDEEDSGDSDEEDSDSHSSG